MNPSFNPKLAAIPQSEFRGGKIGLLVGFYLDVMYRRTSDTRGDALPPRPIHVKTYTPQRCWKCSKHLDDIFAIGPLYCYDPVTKTGLIDIKPPALLESIRWCAACGIHYENSLAKLTCNKCGHVVASVNPGIMPNGFEVRLGMQLHCDACPNCTPGTTDVKILEFQCPLCLISSTAVDRKTATSLADLLQGKQV